MNTASYREFGPLNDVFLILKDEKLCRFSEYFNVSIEKDYPVIYEKAGLIQLRVNENGEQTVRYCGPTVPANIESVQPLAKHYTDILNKSIRERPKRAKGVIKTSDVEMPGIDASKPTVDITNLVYSMPRESTNNERLEILKVFADNSQKYGYLSEEEAFIAIRRDPVTNKLVTVDVLLEKKIDAEYKLSFLATTEYADKNNEGKFKWVYSTPPTYDISKDINTRLNIKKASSAYAKKKADASTANQSVEKPEANQSVEKPEANQSVEKPETNLPGIMKFTIEDNEVHTPAEFAKLPLPENEKLQYLYESWYNDIQNNRKIKSEMEKNTDLIMINELKDIKKILGDKMAGEA